MGKIYTQLIDRFNGGLSEDKRVKDINKFSITKHFDTFTYPHKLVPYPQTATLIGEDKTYNIVKFIYAPSDYISAGTYRLYGWGITDTDRYAFYTLDISSGVGGNWEIAGGYNSGVVKGANVESNKVFFYYKDYIYAWLAGTHLARIDLSNGTWASTYYAQAYTTLCQPLIHYINDIAYFFYDNMVMELNNTTWNYTALTLPDDLKIVCACPYGNYLAIGCTTINTIDQKSMIFIWDMDSTLSTVTELIDLGQGEIKHLVTLDNKLISVSHVKNFITKDKVLIKQASGNVGITIGEITTDVADGIVFYDASFVKTDKLNFGLKATLSNDDRIGIWAVNSLGNVTLDFLNTSNTPTSFEGIYNTGDYWFIAHSADGSTDVSDASGTYCNLANSLYESLIFNGGDSGRTKKLLAFGVMSEPLPSGGQISVEYKIDAETSWTSLIYHNTLDSLYKEAINTYIGVNLPHFKEIQFRLYSQSGAIITGFKFKYEEMDIEVV